MRGRYDMSDFRRWCTVGGAVGLPRMLDPQVGVTGSGRRLGFAAEGAAGRVAPRVAGAVSVAAGVDHVVGAEGFRDLVAVRLDVGGGISGLHG